MIKLAPEIQAYFDAFEQAFTALAAVARSEGDRGKRHNLLYRELTLQLARLEHTFDCWRKKCLFVDRFGIDKRESGFPIFRNVLELETDSNRREETLLDIPEAKQIREQMIELMLKFKQFPSELQLTMARRVYLDTLGDGTIFSAFTPPHTLRHSVNRRNGRPYYVMTWSAYDGTANLPMLYLAVVEDSSEDAPKPRKKSDDDRRGWLSELEFDGLPNFQLRDPFRAFVANNTSYSLNLTTIATAMDKEFPNLHPKQLRRFVLGPFYAGGLTDHNEKVQTVLDGISDRQENWLLTWTMQELYSKEEKPAKHGLWGGAPAEEIYYINTDDVDCAAQGISAIERHALIPHTAYQAAYAKGETDEIFNGYRCYIASGEHILRHV